MVRIKCWREVNLLLKSRYNVMWKPLTCGYQSQTSRIPLWRDRVAQDSSIVNRPLMKNCAERSYLVTVLKIRRRNLARDCYGLMQPKLITTGRRGTGYKFNRKSPFVFLQAAA
jgi:hypothetical protein